MSDDTSPEDFLAGSSLDSPQAQAIRAQGHSRWITTRERLKDDPAALAAYEKARDEHLATWREDLAAERARLLADGGIEDGGIVFVSPEARDKFYASFIHHLSPAVTVDEAYDQIIRTVLDNTSGLPDGDANDLALAVARMARNKGHHTCLDEVLADQEILGTHTDVRDLMAALDVDDAAFEAATEKTAALVTAQPEQMWLLWSNKNQRWWREGGRGYTTDRAEAGRFTGSDALQWYSNSATGWDPSISKGLPPVTLPVPDF